MNVRMMKHPLFAPLAALAAGGFLMLAALGVISFLDMPAPGKAAAEVKIARGMTAGEIARLLKRQGIVRSALMFRAASRVKGFDGRIRAGRYTVPAGMRTSEIARFLVETVPRPIEVRVTVGGVVSPVKVVVDWA